MIKANSSPNILPVLAGVLSHILIKESCVACGKTCPTVPLCPDCEKTRFMVYPPFYDSNRTWSPLRCTSCSRLLISRIGLCSNCRATNNSNGAGDIPIEKPIESFKGLYCVHNYRLWIKSLVFEWKVQSKRLLTYKMAALLDDVIHGIPPIVGLPIVPVPPRPNKIRLSGWDQIGFLCSIMQKKGYKVLHLLKRLTTIQQKHLNAQGRALSASKSYAPCTAFTRRQGTKHPLDVPRSVVLLDDVYTTGATLSACSKVLKDMGVEDVYGLTLFYV